MKIFLTGATGFLGKVVLEELLRRRDEIGLEKVVLLIRPSRREPSPQVRFEKEIRSSPCFSLLPAGSWEGVEVVSGELTQSQCGMKEEDRERFRSSVTHVIHCAASVEFDLPFEIAAEANITTALNALEFAKSCRALKRMVSVSTAYVTPHNGNAVPIREERVRLPRPAEKIFKKIRAGKIQKKKLLREMGLPNTYTATKCLVEHLLCENRGKVPLTIVRPSIISACWAQPFPGWIDSAAAISGFITMIGGGYLRAVIANYPTLLDVVPCDVVASIIVEAARSQEVASGVPIRHAVAGPLQSCNNREWIEGIEGFFQKHPVARSPKLYYVGPRGWRFRLYDAFYHRLPIGLTSLWYRLMRQEKKRRQAVRLIQTIDKLNESFPYFTFQTFRFRSSVPISDPSFFPAFQKKKYVETVCRGIYRHLFRRDDRMVVLAGRKDPKDQGGDLRWAFGQPNGNFAVRMVAAFSRKVLRRLVGEVTFDRPAFEEARSKIPPSGLVAIVPTHRSYMDFVLCSFLFFAHPELGIRIPHIAAAVEFSHIPILGWLFQKLQAFYVRRGLGKEDPETTARIRGLVARQEALEFFIEGTRSRSRQFLEPRRGMLKGLQATGEPFAVLPVAITYDRVPEESAFARELQGAPKPPMRLGSFLLWIAQALLGRIDLGRIHLSCGSPILIDSKTDILKTSREIVGELQKATAVTTHHLKNFLKQNPELSMTLDQLKSEIIQRGGEVIESPLGDQEIPSLVEKTMRYQWIHLFYNEAKVLYRDDPVVLRHIAQNDYRLNGHGEPVEPCVRLLHALFDPISRGEDVGIVRPPLSLVEKERVVGGDR